ncbi:hypothetical protein GO685_04435 [Wolbachia endosymbiont of Madathamugadia hiepei]|nr:hypothetical protein [Wolbachia endosymbiont of Madathamugadia hiepei]
MTSTTSLDLLHNLLLKFLTIMPQLYEHCDLSLPLWKGWILVSEHWDDTVCYANYLLIAMFVQL